MVSIGWSLLEMVLPIETWLRLELHGLPQVVVWMLLLGVIGGLAVAIVEVGLRVVVVARLECVWAVRREPAPPDVPRIGRAHDAPRGGTGPRAPGVLEVRTP